MQYSKHDLIFFVLASTSLVVLMSAFIITVFHLYRKRQQSHAKAIEELKLDFEKNLLHTQLEIQEETLQQISREIHDNISLSLTLAKLQLNTLDWQAISKCKLQVDSSLIQITKALSDLSNISKGMNSELIVNQGLLEVLQKEATQMNQLNLFKLAYTITGNPVFLPAQKELVIFRIIQEAFNNIIKHAKASLVNLTLNYQSDHIEVTISDNGCGFLLEKIKEVSGARAGLGNMTKRAALFNGQTLINSELNHGTTIFVKIPY